MIRNWIITQFRLCRRLFVLNTALNSFRKFPKSPTLFLVTPCAVLLKENSKNAVKNFDLILHEASELGETAIVEVMDFLKQRILEISKDYKSSLKKQIDIMREASEAGPFSPRWNDLPEYRSLSAELNEEFENFIIAVNATIELVQNETVKYITQNKKHRSLIGRKLKELKAVIEEKSIEIKKLEMEVIEAQRKRMSTQRGNNQRNRPQKHQNRTKFKNNLHDTSSRTKQINRIEVSDVCVRCKEIIEWKIKYKKYKPLTQPRKCVKCQEKNVKQAYHVMCVDCGRKLNVCTKCSESKEIVATKPTEQEQVKLDNDMKDMLQSLPERKRRTFMRYMNKLNGQQASKEECENALKSKLEAINIQDLDSDDEFDDSSSIDE